VRWRARRIGHESGDDFSHLFVWPGRLQSLLFSFSAQYLLAFSARVRHRYLQRSPLSAARACSTSIRALTFPMRWS
jgi:hypothetical protein